jgi:hypothetical protein
MIYTKINLRNITEPENSSLVLSQLRVFLLILLYLSVSQHVSAPMGHHQANTIYYFLFLNIFEKAIVIPNKKNVTISTASVV